jgi:lysophospholipase L1-like esterase
MMLASAHQVGLVGGLLTAMTLAAVARADDVALAREALARLGRKSLLFGHQSVGSNVLDGLALLAGPDGGGLRVVDVSRGATTVAAGTLAHAYVGQNGDPASKLDAFARAVDALGEPGVDVALVKLCYVDVTAETDGAALAARYLATLAELRRRHPRTTFVPVTVPLTTAQGGPKAWLKRLLGRSPYGLAENVRREEVNAALRAAAQGGPLFDLARVESTAPDGRSETVTWNGRTAPALVPAYTDDGGHLNRDGKLRAARALLAVLSTLPEAGDGRASR